MTTAPLHAATPPRPSRLQGARDNVWLRFLVRRLLSLVLVLVVLAMVVFVMVHTIPGDPVQQSLGLNADPEIVAQIRADNGFDKPLLEQFTAYTTDVLTGDLGKSFRTGEDVSAIIGQRLGTSLELAVAALLIVLFVSIPLGILMGALTREGRHRKIELGFTSVTSVFGAVPDFLSGTVLAFLFAVQFQIFPVAGAGSPDQLVLPALALSIGPTMTLSRIVRVETLNVLAQDYIRTARSKRLPSARIYARHALPNVVTAALTVGGLIFASIVGGAVAVEVVFARPGLGTALVEAVIAKDYRVVQGITLMLGVTVIIVNATIDILLAIIDPRSLARHS